MSEQKFIFDGYVKTRSEILEIRQDVQDVFKIMPIREFKGNDKWSFMQGILCAIDFILDENTDCIDITQLYVIDRK